MPEKAKNGKIDQKTDADGGNISDAVVSDNPPIEELLDQPGIDLHLLRSLVVGKDAVPAMKGIPGLVGLNPLWDLMQLVIWTGRVVGEKPVSVIIVADAGSGKTSLIEKLHCEPFTQYTDDLTAREISKILNNHRQATHILLGDMMALFSHRQHVVSLACSELRRCVEEGIGTDSFTGITNEKRRQLGLITAIPYKDFCNRRVQRQMSEGGFGSRFLIVRYHYRPETKSNIHNFIQSDGYTKGLKAERPDLEGRYMRIEIPDDIAEQIRHYANFLKGDPLGARAHHQMRTLVKAAAIQDGRDIAVYKDFQRVVYHSDFFTKEGKWL